MNLRAWTRHVEWSNAAALIVLAVAPFALHWQVTFGMRAFGDGDIGRLFLPFGTEFARALNEGRLPLWTTLIQGGFPLLAEGHVAALYPLNHILFRVFPPYLAVSYSMLLHQASASVGMFLFARRFGLRASSAFLAAIVFGWGGFFTTHLQHVTLLATASYLPWLALAQMECQRASAKDRARRLRWFVVAAAFIALELLSGFPQIALLNFGVYLLLALFGPFVWGDARESLVRALRGGVKYVFVSFTALGLGAGLAAAQLVPAQELLGMSVRASGLSAEFLTSFSLDPRALSQFLFPFSFLGAPIVLNQEYWGYVGIAPFLLLFAAPFVHRNRASIFFLLVATFTLAFALGGSNPTYQLLAYVPLINRFRVPARFLLPFVFSAAMLVAFALNALRDRLPSPAAKRARNAIAILFAALLAGVLLLGERQEQAFWIEAWSWLPIALLLFAAAIFAAYRRRINGNVFAAVVIGLTMLDLALFQLPFLSTLNARQTPAEILDAPRVFRAMDDAPDFYRFFTNVYSPSLRPNRPMVLSKASAQIDSPLNFDRHENFIVAMSPAMANLMNIRYVIQHSGDLPPDYSYLNWHAGLDILQTGYDFPATPVARVEIVSYTEDTESLGNETRAGEIIFTTSNQTPVVLPLRLGIETADWASEGLGALNVAHAQPRESIHFPAFLISLRREFDGLKYVARFDFPAPQTFTSVRARVTLPRGKLFIERVTLYDAANRPVSLAALANRNEQSVVFKSHAVTLYENQSVLPRAFLAYQAIVLPDERILARLKEPSFPADRVLLLSDDAQNAKTFDLGTPAPFTPDAPRGSAEIVEYRSERIVVRVNSPRAGYLFLADAWYPGWNAQIDGKPAPIYRADSIFRAVPIDTGAHEIVFEFRPLSFYIGALISAASLGFALVLLFFSWKMRS